MPWTIEWLDEVASTMDEARLRAERGAAHLTAVAAKAQHSGRGRHGRVWQSPPGNLYVTAVLRPAIPARRVAELGFVAALAVAEAVDGLAGPGTTLKWPNDVLRHGAKLCGVLLERLHDGAVLLGIGLNIRHAPEDAPYPATSLAAEGLHVEAAVMLRTILARFDAGWAAWDGAGFAPVLARWSRRGPALGAPMQVRLPCELVTGRYAGLGNDGSLLLETGGGRRTLTAGDVLL